jgi:hypothetical protein
MAGVVAVVLLLFFTDQLHTRLLMVAGARLGFEVGLVWLGAELLDGADLQCRPDSLSRD